MTTHPAIPLDFGLTEDSGSRFAACGLSGDLHAAGSARQFTRATLSNWGMLAIVDTASIVVSEMLTNAVRYGLDDPAYAPLSSRPVWLGLLRREEAVLCTVADPGTGIPVVKEPDWFAETGRGLHIIDSLSESWGWTPPDEAGKSVWALISAPM
ncbi:ATP-binding protein [Actinacidiphila glaucinigra]|uniref:Anti-sigma regulatory factor (Ser/Thr protein kinase) n=1 Tax=Actinacidiphila glaucinigra TaxID=235986 RepID=A0A239M4M4_9ACTN|nr:ATP-binding protein [Actinacidiphila glaucinigra]SNT36944.1 Anti-sigma regulatory factor (Ser/Thr protein kinase) [Actinacidiphila glaucinigra]